jgi:hypothetical protein
MTQEAMNGREDLEQVRRRFEEYRSTQAKRGRLPESLWTDAAKLAKRYGVNVAAHELRLDYSKLKRQMEERDRPKRKEKESSIPAFVELVGRAPGAVTNCSLEVESAKGGKLRLDLTAVATTEIAGLIRAFMGH